MNPETKTQHTPGPWTVCGGSVVKSSRRHPICDTYMWASNSSGTGPEITKANARLIAAAPELLAACKLALELFENGLVDFKHYGLSCDNDIGELYRAAIAKAIGGDK